MCGRHADTLSIIQRRHSLAACSAPFFFHTSWSTTQPAGLCDYGSSDGQPSGLPNVSCMSLFACSPSVPKHGHDDVTPTSNYNLESRAIESRAIQEKKAKAASETSRVDRAGNRRITLLATGSPQVKPVVFTSLMYSVNPGTGKSWRVRDSPGFATHPAHSNPSEWTTETMGEHHWGPRRRK